MISRRSAVFQIDFRDNFGSPPSGSGDAIGRGVRCLLAAAMAGDDAGYDRLRAEQQALGRFRPWMTHSVYEGAPTILFHKQMLHDYVTVDAYGWTLLGEFDR
jgi:hypothetical protein